jgi:hypothetical protein
MRQLIPFLLLLLLLTAGASAQVLPCFFNTAHNSVSNSFIGNAVTHDNQNNGSVWKNGSSPELATANQVYGNGGFILIGPVFYVSTPCVTDMVSFRVGTSAAALDTLHQHFVCSGGTAPGQGATVAGNPATAGTCPGGGTAVAYDNTYDVGLFCVGGSCTYGKLYVDLGPVVYSNFFAVAPGKTETLFWQQGATLLPVGLYSIGMGTNCDSGSTPGIPKGGKHGYGGTGCGQATGEGGSYGFQLGSNKNTWHYGTEVFPHKYLTNQNNTALHSHCLIYDPSHNNTAALPPTLTTYDGTPGGCNIVDTGSVTPGSANTGFPITGLPPHLVNFAVGFSGR